MSKAEPCKVINLKTYRVLRERREQEIIYWYKLLSMEKTELLNELLKYHEAYQQDPHDVNVTIRGKLLMEVLESRAHLTELQELTQEFQARLDERLEKQLERY